MMDRKQRMKNNFCRDEKCVPDCPYCNDMGEIYDVQIVKEFDNEADIVKIGYYKKLGDKMMDSILKMTGFFRSI